MTERKPMVKEVSDLMERHKFKFGSSREGGFWWTRDNGDGTFTAITDLEGSDSPRSLDDHILVGRFPSDRNEDLDAYQQFSSLKEYFKT